MGSQRHPAGGYWVQKVPARFRNLAGEYIARWLLFYPERSKAIERSGNLMSSRPGKISGMFPG